MSEAIKPTLLHKDQVYALNEKHGWFEFRDAQSDVSRAFANDAIAEYERVRNEATAVCVATGLTPRQLLERVWRLEEHLKLIANMPPTLDRDDPQLAVRIAQDALSQALPNTVAEVK